jgi:hypothetical protein
MAEQDLHLGLWHALRNTSREGQQGSQKLFPPIERIMTYLVNLAHDPAFWDTIISLRYPVYLERSPFYLYPHLKRVISLPARQTRWLGDGFTIRHDVYLYVEGTTVEISRRDPRAVRSCSKEISGLRC